MKTSQRNRAHDTAGTDARRALGRSIQIRRMGVGLSRERVAKALLTTPLHIKAIEKGTVDIGVDELVQLAELLLISPECLFDGSLEQVVSPRRDERRLK